MGPLSILIVNISQYRFDAMQSTDELWELHDKALRSFKVQNTIQSPSLLDLKIELADRLFQACCFCEHRCKVDRRKTLGVCGVQEARIATEFLHFGEESVLVPSHTIFFSGCTFQCVFCQNWDISQLPCGTFIDPEKLGKKIEERRQQGARNVNWVGGDPTSNLLYILQVLQQMRYEHCTGVELEHVLFRGDNEITPWSHRSLSDRF